MAATTYRTQKSILTHHSAVTLKLAEIFLDAGNNVLGGAEVKEVAQVIGKVHLTFSDPLPADPGPGYYELDLVV